MPKSRAAIQKVYRERKKATEGENYLKKETKRVKTYYRPTTDIATHKLNKRREKIKECMRKKRRLMKQAVAPQIVQQSQSLGHRQELEDETDRNPGPCDSTSTGDIIIPVASTSSASSNGAKIHVKMDFRKKSSRGKEITKTKLKLRTLNQKVKALTIRNETLRKRVYRGSGSEKSTPNDRKTQEQSKITPSKSKKRKLGDEYPMSELTPKSKLKVELRKEGVSPSKHPRLVKTLAFHNSLVKDISESIDPKRGRPEQREIVGAVCGKAIRKNRLKSKAVTLE